MYFSRKWWLITSIGQLGRVAVIGGSEDYTGAPYFSAMASARLGADMVSSQSPKPHNSFETSSTAPSK
jgi:NAD(P)H-hydrate repair Nnr-like enzyme with NAD(P)H-hydrate dehydratase domain